MEKQIILTEENYQEYPPSVLVRSFLYDIETMRMREKQLGMICNMSSYIDVDGCLGCIGGHAAMNILGRTKPRAPSLTESRVAYHVAMLGDDIRNGFIDNAIREIIELFPAIKIKRRKIVGTLPHHIWGIMDAAKYAKLEENVNTLADILESHNL